MRLINLIAIVSLAAIACHADTLRYNPITGRLDLVGTGSGGGSSSLGVNDEGVSVTTPTAQINFVGAGVTVTANGSTATVTIPGGGSGSLLAGASYYWNYPSSGTFVDMQGITVSTGTFRNVLDVNSSADIGFSGGSRMRFDPTQSGPLLQLYSHNFLGSEASIVFGPYTESSYAQITAGLVQPSLSLKTSSATTGSPISRWFADPSSQYFFSPDGQNVIMKLNTSSAAINGSLAVASSTTITGTVDVLSESRTTANSIVYAFSPVMSAYPLTTSSGIFLGMNPVAFYGNNVNSPNARVGGSVSSGFSFSSSTLSQVFGEDAAGVNGSSGLGGGTATTVFGVRGIGQTDVASLTSSQYGLWAQTKALFGSTVTVNYGLLVSSPVISNNSVVNDSYGVYIDSQTGRGRSRAIFTAGAAPSYLGGTLTLPFGASVSTLTITGLTSQGCIGTDGSGNVQAGTCSGGSGSLPAGASYYAQINPASQQAGAVNVTSATFAGLRVSSNSLISGASFYQDGTVELRNTFFHTDGPPIAQYLIQDQFAGNYGIYTAYRIGNTIKGQFGMDLFDYLCTDGVTQCASVPFIIKGAAGQPAFSFDQNNRIAMGRSWMPNVNPLYLSGEFAMGNFGDTLVAPPYGGMISGDVVIGTNSIPSGGSRLTVKASTSSAFGFYVSTSTAGGSLVALSTSGHIILTGLNKGTTGQFLASGGEGAPDYWSDAPAGGGGSGGYNLQSSTITPTFPYGINVSSIANIATGDINIFTSSVARISVQGNGALTIMSTTTIQAQFRIGDPLGNTDLTMSTNSAASDAFELNVSSQNGTVLIGVQNNGHIISSGTTPVLSSCGATPLLDGTDTAGVITGGTGSTGCTLTFARPYLADPVCVISQQSMSVVNALTYTHSTTAITITQTGLGTGKLDYICFGSQ